MTKITRRRFLQYAAGASAFAAMPWTARPLFSAPKLRTLSKFVQPLPVPGAGIVVATPYATNSYKFTQTQIARKLHPDLPATPLWAYDDGDDSALAGQAGSFGMVIAATAGVPLDVSFTHGLPETYPSWLPVDTDLTMHGDQVWLMTHLHGGFVDGASDGNPAATPAGYGPGQTQTVRYTNETPQTVASMLWFHDHAMGNTRLNVFAGLAGAYIIRDGYDTGLAENPAGLPYGDYEIPLVIQDRSFNADGTFLYPKSTIPGVTWIGEYFGDVMLVNGKVWPFLNVEPRMYRLRILNGCNARILNLDMGGAKMWQIGAEGGLFDVPVPVKQLVMAPAERADVLVDFSKFPGAKLQIKNHKLPKPVVSPGPMLDTVMQLRVGTRVTQPGPKTVPSVLNGGRRANIVGPIKETRYITLNEVNMGMPDWYLNMNGVRFHEAARNPDYMSITAGSVEDWVYINMSGDTHPMHMHLAMFQVIGRTPFDVAAYAAINGGPDGVPGGIDPTPFATGPMEPPDATERGFKDTVKANPGYFTTIRAKFELPVGVTSDQKYVQHCHIVEHEDNDMMLPFTVVVP